MVQDYLFDVDCNEKGGIVRRRVRMMPRDIAHLIEVVDKMQQVPNFLPKHNPIEPMFSDSTLFFEVDDVGMIAVVPTHYAKVAHCHITFWDKRLRGREQLCRNLCEVVRGLCKYSLLVAIPEDRPTVIEFAKRVGFQPVSIKSGIHVLHYDNPNYPE
jgi:hypothetical protein